MNTLSTPKYSWDDTIEVTLSTGRTVSIRLSDLQESKYMGYGCTNCGSPSTLAFGNCGSCGSPFEPREDIEEAKSLFPDVEVQVENPDRLVWILQHRNWLCTQCDSYNINLPRDQSSAETTSCINCGHGFDEKEDILFEDSFSHTPGTTAEAFKEAILEKIQEHKKQKTRYTGETGRTGNVLLEPPTDNKDTYSASELSSPGWRNGMKVLVSVFGLSIAGYAMYYGFIEKIPYKITVTGHDWKRVGQIDKYQKQDGDGWKKDTSSRDFYDFELVRTVQKEALWDSYEHDTGRDRDVEDRSNCITYNSPKEQCTNPSETCDEATINGITVPVDCYTPDPVCYTPEKICLQYGTKVENIMETRYHKHPYVYYTYMDWEKVESLTSSGIGKKPYWEESQRYTNIDSHPNLRFVEVSETYNISIDLSDGGEQKVKLSFTNWDGLDINEKCSTQGTRWGGVSSDDIEKCIQN